MLKSNPELAQAFRDTVDARYINNETICTAVSGDKVADYINSGWKYGRLKRKV